MLMANSGKAIPAPASPTTSGPIPSATYCSSIPLVLATKLLLNKSTPNEMLKAGSGIVHKFG